MKKSKRIFSIVVVASMLFWEISPVLPVLARQSGDAVDKIKSESIEQTDFKKQEQEPVTTDWSAVDWDEDIMLLSDMSKYRNELESLASEGKPKELKQLQPKSTTMSSEEAMEYFVVPDDIRELVREYRDEQGVFSKKKDKKVLQDLVKSTMPTDFEFQTLTRGDEEEQIVNVSKAEKIDVRRLISTNETENKLIVKIKSVKNDTSKRDLNNVTVDGLDRKTKERGLPGTKVSMKNVGSELGQKFYNFLAGIFKTQTVYADDTTPLIEYYDEIENNFLDNALYYISQSQNPDGSFGQTVNYEETAEVALMLSQIKRTSNTQFNDVINYLIATEPQNNRELAIKARLMTGLGESYLDYLDALSANQNEDHGYGLDTGLESDMLTTAEAALAMYAADYSIQDKLPLALYYVLNHIPEDGALRYTPDGPVSYYLINKVVQSLKPFATMTVGNGEVGINVQDKIDDLLGYLSSQFDEDSQKILGTNDIIDQIMTLQTWQVYNVEVDKRIILENTVRESQYINGSFDNSILATTKVIQTLKQPDLVLTDLQSVGSLVSKQSASFDLTIKNQGYTLVNSGKIYVFPDNFNSGLTLDLASNGIIIQPNQTITINITVSNTKSYTGVMDMKFYVENSGDYNYENNWIYKNFTFTPAVDGTPALPMYFIAQKYENGGVAGLNVRWPKKTDPNRLNYVIMWREKGTTEWNFQGISNTWNGAFLTGAFVEGKTYEVTAGVLHQDGGTVTYFVNYNDVVVSGDPGSYLGGVTGYATNNNDRFPNAYTWGYSVSKTTDDEGNFAYTARENGTTAAWLDIDYYESIITKFFIPVNATTTDIRLFSRLRPDDEAPVMNTFELRWATNYVVKNQTEYSLLAFGDDNIGLKEADFYLWNPTEEIWTFLGTEAVTNSSQAMMTWYIPDDLLGAGFKVKGVFSDYQGNKSNELEWGPFEIINGTSPTFEIITPNGGEEWSLGSTQTITWNYTSVNNIPNVNLYSVYPTTYDYIKSSVANTGSYEWQIPNNSYYAGTKIKVRINGTDSVNGKVGVDESDDYFSLVDNSPKPADPWSYSTLLSNADELEPVGGEIQQSAINYDSLGNVHVVYLYVHDKIGTPRIITQKLYHIIGYVDGTWSEPTLTYEKVIETDNGLTGYISIYNLMMEIDTANNPHLFWRTSGFGGCESMNTQEVYYMNYDGAQWSEPINISNNNTETRDLDFTSDRQGNFYAIWLDGLTWDSECSTTGTRKIYYEKWNENGNWQPLQILQQPDKYPSNPQIVIGDSGQTHLVYKLGEAGKVGYTYWNGLVWSSPTTVFVDEDYSSDGQLAVGPNDFLHYVYREWYSDPVLGSSRSRIMYTYFNGIVWSSPEEVSPILDGLSADYPRIAVDDNNIPHVIFQHSRQNPYQEKVAWTSKTNLTGEWDVFGYITPESQFPYDNSAQLLYHNDKLSAIWYAGYSRKTNLFYGSADLTLDYTPPQVVQNFQFTAGPMTINLAWDLYTNTDGDFDHFNIYRNTTSTQSIDLLQPIEQVSDVNVVNYIDNDVEIGEKYYYSIVVVDKANNKSEPAGWVGPSSPLEPLKPEIKLLIDNNEVVSGSNYNLGETNTGLSFGVDFTIENNGLGVLELDSLLNAKDNQGNTCGSIDYDESQLILSSGASTTLYLQLDNNSVGEKQCNLLIENNDEDENPYLINFNYIVNLGGITFFNGSSSSTIPWVIADNIPEGANMNIVYEDATYGNVIQFTSDGTNNAFRLRNENNTNWNDNSHKYATWDMNFNSKYYIYVNVSTEEGNKYIRYSSHGDNGITTDGNYVLLNIGSELMDGNWHNVVRDLQADLKTQFPDLTVTKVNQMVVRGTGKMDNVGLRAEASLGTVSGFILDQTGNPMSNVVVKISANGLLSKTNVNGEYSFSSLPYGVYTITPELATYDFTPVSREVTILGDNQLANFTGQFQEIITFFNGSSSSTIPWVIADNIPEGANMNIVYEDATYGNVIQFTSDGTNNAFRLRNENNTNWNDNSHKYATWDMNFNSKYYIYVNVSTEEGNKYIRYSSHGDNGITTDGNYVLLNIGSELMDGNWHNVVRDLQADLKTQFPDLTVTKVNQMVVRGTGKMDNVGLRAGF